MMVMVVIMLLSIMEIVGDNGNNHHFDNYLYS